MVACVGAYAPGMADDSGAALVRRWWTEVWGNERDDLIPELTTEPFTRHSQNGTVVRTHRELAADMQQYRRILHGCSAEFESQFSHADRVFSRIRTTGVNLETEEAMVVHWMQEHRIADGLLAETWVLYTFTGKWVPGDDPPGAGYPSAGVG